MAIDKAVLLGSESSPHTLCRAATKGYRYLGLVRRVRVISRRPARLRSPPNGGPARPAAPSPPPPPPSPPGFPAPAPPPPPPLPPRASSPSAPRLLARP